MNANIVFESLDRSKSKFQKTVFLDFSYGTHQVRLLSQPVLIFVHYFKNRGSITCLGRDCPVCKANKSLQAEYPENYRQQPGYNPSSPRYYINVLDRSPVKICLNPECEHENKMDLMGHFPSSCSKCGTFLGESPVQVSNKIKVANISSTNADRLMALQVSVRDDKDEPLGLGNFDLEFLVTNVKGKKDISVQASTKKNSKDVFDVDENDLYDLNKVVIKLDPDDVVQFLRGVSLKDIFAAKSALKIAPEYKKEEESKEDIENKIEATLVDTLRELGF